MHVKTLKSGMLLYYWAWSLVFVSSFFFILLLWRVDWQGVMFLRFGR